MVAKVSIGGGLSGALGYNQQKVDKEKAKVLETNRVFVPADGRFSLGECVRDFERTMPSQVTTTRGVVHISLNPHPDDKLTDDQLTDIGREYIERMGFGGQPWMLFKHEDIDREHLHIVTTRVRGDGTLISDKNNYEKSRKITDDLERKYGLHPKGKRQGEVRQLRPIDAERGDLKRQVGNVVKSLSEQYKFHSLPGYRALLSLYNVGVEKVEGDNKGHRYTGLVYSALDPDGNRVGQPLKSSLFGKKYGVGELERAMTKSGEEVKTKGLRTTVAALLADSVTGGEFRAQLREKGIDLVLRYGNGGRLFGATFIDHNSRVVLNGSALGKDFAANAIAERFPDLATESRENRRPVLLPTPSPDTTEAIHPVGQSTPAREALQPSAPSPAGNVQTPPAPEASRPVIPSAPYDRTPVTRTMTHDLSSAGNEQATSTREAAQPSAPSPVGNVQTAPVLVSPDTSRPAMPPAPLSGESGPVVRTAIPDLPPTGYERDTPVSTGEPSHLVGESGTGGEALYYVSSSAYAPSEDTQGASVGEPSYTPGYASTAESGPAVGSATDDQPMKHGHGKGTSSGGGLLSLLTPVPGPSDNGPSAPKPKKKKRRYGQQH